MKIYAAALLTLCASHANGFIAQSPKSLTFSGPQTSKFSYLESLGDGDASLDPGLMSREGQSKALEDKLEARLAALEKGKAPVPIGAPGRGSPIKRTVVKKSTVTVQGGSLKTWSFANPAVERVQVVLGTEGRPLDADVELWQGPDNTPHRMRVYVEDGSLRPFKAVIETPRGPNTIAIRNTGQLEFPLAAHVAADASEDPAGPLAAAYSSDMQESQIIQGGALRTYPFEPSVESVRILLKTDGRPLNARIELLQGPNNNKQVVELYTEDGMDRPFFMVIETPGSGNVVRVVNSATVEFPMTAWVEPYLVGSTDNGSEVVLGGDAGGFMTRF